MEGEKKELPENYSNQYDGLDALLDWRTTNPDKNIYHDRQPMTKEEIEKRLGERLKKGIFDGFVLEMLFNNEHPETEDLDTSKKIELLQSKFVEAGKNFDWSVRQRNLKNGMFVREMFKKIDLSKIHELGLEEQNSLLKYYIIYLENNLRDINNSYRLHQQWNA